VATDSELAATLIGGWVKLLRHSPECRQLEKHFDGLRFNRMKLRGADAEWLRSFKESAWVEVSVSVSGSQKALLQHGFIKPAWVRALPACGSKHFLDAEHHDDDRRLYVTVRRSRHSYNVCGTWPELLDRITPALAGLIWTPPKGRILQ
jgi:hypothetical protein